MKILGQRRATLFTSNYIVAETHAMLLRYLGPAPARAFLQEMDKSVAMVILRADGGDETAARAIIYHYEDKDFSLVDAISFVVKERLRIRKAFTFDKHFVQHGIDVIGSEDAG